jgi:hypothetical protein
LRAVRSFFVPPTKRIESMRDSHVCESHRLERGAYLCVRLSTGDSTRPQIDIALGRFARVVVADELRDGRLAALNMMAPSTRDVLVVDHLQKHHGAACRAMLALLA